MNNKYNELIAIAKKIVESNKAGNMYDTHGYIDELEDVLLDIAISNAAKDTNNEILHLMHITGLSYQDSLEALAMITNTQHDDF